MNNINSLRCHLLILNSTDLKNSVMAKKFNLKWKDFQSNVTNTFKTLRTFDHFYDVTLVSDDQQQVSAHKVVLASSSEYFKNILTSNKHAHPMLCLNGVKNVDLKNILDFLYNGEIQMYQDNLDNFLDIAQRFQIEGLLQVPRIEENCEEPEHLREDALTENENTVAVEGSQQVPWIEENCTKPEPLTEKANENMVAVVDKFGKEMKVKMSNGRVIATEFINENTAELDYKIEKMIERLSDGTYQCTTCGKVSREKHHMKDHAEYHVGMKFPCKYCGKSYKTRKSIKDHVHKTCLKISKTLEPKKHNKPTYPPLNTSNNPSPNTPLYLLSTPSQSTPPLPLYLISK